MDEGLGWSVHNSFFNAFQLLYFFWTEIVCQGPSRTSNSSTVIPPKQMIGSKKNRPHWWIWNLQVWNLEPLSEIASNHYLSHVNCFMRKTFLPFITFLFFTSFLSAQNSAEPGGFRHITVRDGLPSSEVYKILQDRFGYLWMCTDAGVCRYNGYSFQSFTTRDGLTDNTVFGWRKIIRENYGRRVFQAHWVILTGKNSLGFLRMIPWFPFITMGRKWVFA